MEDKTMVQDFGKIKSGQETKLYWLTNERNMKVSVSDYGATLVNVLILDKEGKQQDVVLGYDDAKSYEQGDKFFGAVVGRNANRIGGACFKMNGNVYSLSQNDNGNNLHSGPDYYSKRMWSVKEADDTHIICALKSPDNDQGYPSAVDIEVSYTLTSENEIKIHYYAVPQGDTILNMTNHSYFNLNGQDAGDILNQEIWLDADYYTRTDRESIPTGEITEVTGTPMDFRHRKAIGRDINADYEALLFGKGYDHNYFINGSGKRKAAAFFAKQSGICMDIYTDLPGIQLYTGNFLIQERGKQGVVYGKRQGVCFETQYFPDAVNKEAFTSPLVKGQTVYETETIYQFGYES